MSKNRQIAVIFLVLGVGTIAVVGFSLGGGCLRDKSYFNEYPDNSSDLFLNFKTSKERNMKEYRNGIGNVGNIATAEHAIFCWNKESGKYEKTSFDPSKSTVAPGDNFGNSSRRAYADLNRNNIQEEYVLEDGRITVRENSKIIWQSDENWWVEDFFLADSDNDGVMNLNLSVWKSGDFGKYKPFWVKENDPSVKNHFFVFALKNNDMKSIWQSSNLSAPNCRIIFSDLDGDGENELVALEGDYIQSPHCRGKFISVWKWNEWGFINEWRSEEGEFYGVGVGNTIGGKCILSG